MPLKLRAFLGLWSVLWHLFLPLVIIYLRRRARKDALYGMHLKERFGRFDTPMTEAIWVHAVSLGELRSAVPMIQAFLDQGEKVVVTQFTPAGRRETEKVFADAIATGQLQTVWVPFETSWAFKGFFKTFSPKFGLVMEIEIWPRMVMASKRAGIPLFMCNAQYPSKSIVKDQKTFGLRPAVMAQFAGAFVKSDLQAERFVAVNVPNIHVTGELRFDQPIPPALIAAGPVARSWLGAETRPVITLGSTVEGEDALYIETMKLMLAKPGPKPLFVYVPRRPERFDEINDMLVSEGFRVLRRSATFPDVLTSDTITATTKLDIQTDIFLGDSLGEMYFYLSMADKSVVGGGFVPAGAHNIIEPLALKKPVITGPETWTIEYPFAEAEAAGVACAKSNATALAQALADGFAPSEVTIDAFFENHAGGTQKLMRALPSAMAAARSRA
ncbi:3-deoxy-D-manno-octulosonic acid transferase [Shimia sagamensis]|uniref:3-deoxy-D-manno-octulosonic acid transferase n=1 Tax=Shimia sagamensis TaxID=1566352 RepID=A0ABY1PFK9_9RHOB|nr:glycosyltransferase N-terminal domain-containing protein [Shimia sagamensis]SMP32517.1 3-deoxy-D-manno-octulosonic-acid transferase [Shimia sagamensis]